MFRDFEFYFHVLSLVILLGGRDTLQEDPLQCGVPKVSKAELIVRGSDTVRGAWPWHTAIYHKNGRSDTYACGGTLISGPFVLTAAHCVINPDNRHQLVNSRIFVRLGVHNLDSHNDFIQRHGINRIFTPDHFTGYGFRNDIAILELGTVPRLTDYVQPACLSLSKDLTGLYGTVIGWGVTENDQISPTLKGTRIPVVDVITCLQSNRDVFGPTLDDGIFCAGYRNGTSVCNGDSGGGLFFKVGNAWHLGGVVSYAEARAYDNDLCDTNNYAAFTKVYKYLPWISSVTKLKFSKSTEELAAQDLRLDNDDDDTSQLLPRNCGVRSINRNIQGNKTDILEFPWLAAIISSQGSKYFLTAHDCSGSLINVRYVLTEATDCISKYFGLSSYRVLLGGLNKDPECIEGMDPDCVGLAEEYGIESYETHPRLSGSFIDNIGLIRLNRDVTMKEYIRPICLPVAHELRTKSFDSYTVVSFMEGTHIFKVDVDYVKSDVCDVKLGSPQLFYKLLCAKRNDGSCNYLGGSFLGKDVNYNGVRFVQFGVFHFWVKASRCTSLYTPVSIYMDWILDTIRP